MKLAEMVYYPVKSMRGIALETAYAGPMGLPHDRVWLLTDKAGKFITARRYPQLLLWQARPVDAGVLLTAPDGDSYIVEAGRMRQSTEVTVWDDTFPADSGCEAANRWLSEKLGVPVTIHYLGDSSRRTLAYSQTPLSFADGAPYLLTGMASLEALNQTLAQAVDMRCFRPNLVFGGGTAYAEEDWKRIRIGEVVFELFKPCTRCVMTTVDLTTGEKSPTQEPLKTLAKTRKAVFGMNMIALNSGTLRVGDAVTVLA